jgi:hypothetical protein
MTPLALTDHQLALVRDAARALPVPSRDAFLQAVAAHLIAPPTDQTVSEAITAALDALSTRVFLCDGKENIMIKDDDDDTTMLKDGQIIRVPMMMRDSWRADMHRHFHGDSGFGFDRRRTQTRKYDPKGRLISTAEEEEETEDAMSHKPRFVSSTDAAALDAKEAAYREYDERMANAWKTDSASKEGTACMTDDKRAGTLVRNSDGRLVCRPNAPKDAAPPFTPTGDVAYDNAMTAALALTDARARAYALRDVEDTFAWRKP